MSKASNPNLLQNAQVYNDQSRKLLSQILARFSLTLPTFSFVNKVDAINGGVEIVYQGLVGTSEINDLGRKDRTITDINAKGNKILHEVYYAEKIDYAKIFFPRDAFIEAFANPETARAFTAERAKVLALSIQRTVFKETLKVLFKLGGARLSITYDDTIDSKKTGSGNSLETTDARTKRVLRLIRLKLRSFKSLGNHTAFAETNKGSDNPFETTLRPEDFTFFANNEFVADTENLAAYAFNKNDILLKVNQVSYDFTKIAGLTNPEKYVGLLVHNDAVKFILQ